MRRLAVPSTNASFDYELVLVDADEQHARLVAAERHAYADLRSTVLARQPFGDAVDELRSVRRLALELPHADLRLLELRSVVEEQRRHLAGDGEDHHRPAPCVEEPSEAREPGVSVVRLFIRRP